MKLKSTLRSFLALAGSSLLTVTYASATPYYWDSNDGTTGFGVAAGTWTNATLASATGSITYGTPLDGDTVTVNGVTLTKVAALPGANEFTTITELTALVDVITGVNATDDGSVVSITAATAGTAGNAITLAATGAMTVSGATLTGGASPTPSTTTNGWSTDSTGSTTISVDPPYPAYVTTTTSDDLFFGSPFILSLTGAATTISTTTVTCDSTASLTVGMTVTGTGIPASTTVASVTNPTTFELSLPATATGAALTLSATLPLGGTVTIVGPVAANSIYWKTGFSIAGTTPTINFSATGSVETTGSTVGFPAGTTLTGAGTSMTWKAFNNLNISNITSNSAGSTILQNSPENTADPGKVVMNKEANLGVALAPLVFDGGGVRMLAGFPYTDLAALNTAHPVSFTLNKDAQLDNSAGGPTFTVNMAVNLGTGVFFANKGGSGAVAPIILTSSANIWNEVRIAGGILEIDNLNQLGTTTLAAEAPLRFGSGYTSGASGTLRIVGTGVTSFGTRSMLTTPTKLVGFDIADALNTFTVDQLLDQTTGGFTKAGPGSLIINTTSSYTGTTTVSGGTLSYGTALGIATGAVTVNGAGAVLAYGAYDPSVGVVTLTNGTVTGSGTLTSSAAFVCNPVSPNVFPVGIKLGGTLGLNKTGTGTTTLSLDNSGLSGPVLINGGILNINSTNALGTGAVTLTSGTIDNTSGTAKALSTDNTITLAGNFAFTTLSGTASNNLNLGNGAVSITGNRTITLNGTGTTLTLGGVMTNNQANNTSLTANGPGNTLVIGGGIECSSTALTNRTITLTGTGNIVVSGAINNGNTAAASALTKTGTGTLTLNGNNTYDGLTSHTGASGTLNLNGDNSGAAGGVTLNNATAVLNINSNTALGSGTTTLTAGIFDNTSGSLKTTTGTTAVLLAGTTTWGGSNDLTLGGPVNINASRTITLNGAATLTLANLVNTQGGNPVLTVTAGTGNNLVIGGLDLSNTATPRTVTVQGTANTTVTGAVSGSSLGGSEGIASPLTKSGTGTLTLQGNNTYTGATTVNTDGCLALVGGSQDSAITVNSGGFLGFTLGSPTTSTNNVTLAAGHKVRITGTPTLAGYILLTTSATISGAPDIETAIPGYELAVLGGGKTLVLRATPSTPFKDWALLKGLDGTAGKENGEADDPDGDGKNNKFEFAFNGNPLSGSDNGMIAGLVQDASLPAGNELTLIVAVRDGATFANAGSPVVQTATVDGVTYTIQGTLDLATIPGSDVSQAAGPSDTAPVATGLPDLTGTDWEYHTFKLDASEGLGDKGFLRAKAE